MDWRELLEYGYAILAIIATPFISFATYDYLRAKSRKTKADTKKVELEVEKLKKPTKRSKRRRKGR